MLCGFLLLRFGATEVDVLLVLFALSASGSVACYCLGRMFQGVTL